MELLQVLADRGQLDDHLTVVGLECRGLHHRVEHAVGRPAMLSAGDVDRLERQVDPLLEGEHAHRVWIGSERIVELHAVPLRLWPTAYRNYGCAAMGVLS